MADWHSAEVHLAEWHSADIHWGEWHSAEHSTKEPKWCPSDKCNYPQSRCAFLT